MFTIILHIPLSTPFGEFARLVVTLKGGGYRIGEATFTETIAIIQFNRTE